MTDRLQDDSLEETLPAKTAKDVGEIDEESIDGGNCDGDDCDDDDDDDDDSWFYCGCDEDDVDDEETYELNDLTFFPLERRGTELWRNDLIQNCLKVARNDKAFTCFYNWCGEKEWTNADLMLLGHSLVGNTHLQVLSLSINPTVCMLLESDLGAKALRRGVAESKLSSLKLVGVCCQLQTCILEGVAMSTKLRQLTMSSAPVNIPCLTSIIIASNGMTPPAVDIPSILVKYRANIASSNNNGTPSPLPTEPTSPPLGYLTRLSLIRCKLDNIDMLAISLALADNSGLVALFLNFNFISNVGVVYFCQHWRINSPLQELDLSGNRIGPNGAQLIMTATTKRPAMRALLLNYNGSVGHEGLQLIGEQLPHLIALRYLGIHGCAPLGTDKSKTQALACRALADGLRGNTSLKTLRVGENKLGVKGVQMLMRSIAVHPRLKELLLQSDDSIGLAGLIAIGSELPFVKLRNLQLNSLGNDLLNPQTKLACKAGQALLQGVQRNHYITEFYLENLDERWMTPIQFHVDLNQTCRPLLSRASITNAVWPYILAQFCNDDRISQAYFVLLEQPWLVNNNRGIF